MVVYIPDKWFHDIKNKDVVFRIFSDIPDTDIIHADLNPEQDVEKRLAELGELTILENYRKGYFAVG